MKTQKQVQFWLSSILFILQGSIIAEISSSSADGCSTSVLLDCWDGPSCELAGRPVIKGLLSVVMSVPKRIAGEVCADVSVPHDLVPHVATCINSYASTSCFYSLHQLLQIDTVLSPCALIPRAARAWVGFDIQPNGASLVLEPWSSSWSLHHWVEIVNKLIDLESCVLSSAGEHVDISWEAIEVGLSDIFRSGCIDGSITMVSPDDGVLIS